MSDYSKLGGLELTVDGYTTERRTLELDFFTRVTTTVVLEGGGHTGRGEDVTYEAPEHDSFPEALPLGGSQTLDDYSRRLDELELPDYRRWAFESAALDLALRANGVSLGDAVGRAYRPVRFVVSTRGDINLWLEHDPTLEFKVDAAGAWTRETMEAVAASGRVRCVDVKAYYVGEWVDTVAPALYGDVLEAFPEAVIEDAAVTDETIAVLRPAAERLSFDAPIHSVADIASLALRPGHMNIKPSRFGSVRRLFDALAHCEANAMRMYGGGQFELGVGRDHIQAIASLYYADGANDVAPSAYNEPPPRAGLARSPLKPAERPLGLSFARA